MIEQRFPPKTPAEAIVLEFDFTLDLDSGETIVGQVAPVVTVEPGLDAAAHNIIGGDGAIDDSGTVVLLPVRGGLASVDYTIRVPMATSNTQKILEAVGVLPVRD